MRPVVVVDHADLIIALRHEELFHLSGERVHVSLNLLQRLQGAFGLTSAWIPDGTGRAPDQNDRTMAGKLEAFEHDEGNQVTDMHAVACRIHAAVQRNRLFIRKLPEAFGIRLLVDRIAPFQFVDNIHSVNTPSIHDFSL